MAPTLAACAEEQPKGERPLFEISLAQWSLHRTFFGGHDAMDFARMAREDYDVDAVEYVNSFFKDKATDAAYLALLRRAAEDHGVKSLLIMIDGEGAIGDPDPAKRKAAVENHHKWVEAARTLGCHSIRVNAQSAGTEAEQRDRVVDGLRTLIEFADPHEINVIVENHGGLSSNGKWLSSVLAAVDHPRCGSLPDFGNFRIDAETNYDRYRGVEEMMPFAKAVSAKSNDFDADGNEKHTDYERMVRIVLKAGYRGWIGIEYEGENPDEPAGIRATKTLLERVRGKLAGEFSA
jgi:sugar phosphate isomerase/epimerase